MHRLDHTVRTVYHKWAFTKLRSLQGIHFFPFNAYHSKRPTICTGLLSHSGLSHIHGSDYKRYQYEVATNIQTLSQLGNNMTIPHTTPTIVYTIQLSNNNLAWVFYGIIAYREASASTPSKNSLTQEKYI